MSNKYAPEPALLAKAETLVEALPYIQRYAGETFVGHATDADTTSSTRCEVDSVPTSTPIPRP